MNPLPLEKHSTSSNARSALLEHLASASGLGERAGTEIIPDFETLLAPFYYQGYSFNDVASSWSFSSSASEAFANAYLAAFPYPASEAPAKRQTDADRTLASIDENAQRKLAVLADQALLCFTDDHFGVALRRAVALIQKSYSDRGALIGGKLSTATHKHIARCISSGHALNPDKRIKLITILSERPDADEDYFATLPPWTQPPVQPLSKSLLSSDSAANEPIGDFIGQAQALASEQDGATLESLGLRPSIASLLNTFATDNPLILARHPHGFFDGNALIVPAAMAGTLLGAPSPFRHFNSRISQACLRIAEPESDAPIPLLDPWEAIELYLDCGLSNPIDGLMATTASFAAARGLGLRETSHAQAELALGRALPRPRPEPDLADTRLLHAFLSSEASFAKALQSDAPSPARWGTFISLCAAFGRADDLRAVLSISPSQETIKAIPRALGLAATTRDDDAALQIVSLLAPLSPDLDAPAPWGMGLTQTANASRGEDSWIAQSISALDQARKLRVALGEHASIESVPATRRRSL